MNKSSYDLCLYVTISIKRGYFSVLMKFADSWRWPRMVTAHSSMIIKNVRKTCVQVRTRIIGDC